MFKQICVTFLLLVIIKLNSNGQEVIDTRIKLYSESINHIAINDFLFNRNQTPARSFSRIDSLTKIQISQIAFGDFISYTDSISIEDINSCLKSDNPKIRALGLVALYQVDDQKVILKFSEFLRDSAECFKSNPIPMFSEIIRTANHNDLLEKSSVLTVSDVAKAVLRYYHEHSGLRFSEKDLDSFIDSRKNLVYTLGYLNLLKSKATGRINPIQESRKHLVQELKDKINLIPEPMERVIYKYSLSAKSPKLYNEDELILELKTISSDKVKEILSRNIKSKDPDLLKMNTSYATYQNRLVRDNILLNVNYIFNKKDISFLLERAESEYDNYRGSGDPFSSPYWYIASARLDEKNAKRYLSEAIKRSNSNYSNLDKEHLYAELWHLTKLENISFILNWVFSDFKVNQKEVEEIDYFFGLLNDVSDLELLKIIINDDRIYNSLSVKSIIKIARQFNLLKGEKVIARSFINDIWHPFGIDRADSNRDMAFEKYPNETKNMIEKKKILISELKKIK